MWTRLLPRLDVAEVDATAEPSRPIGQPSATITAPRSILRHSRTTLLSSLLSGMITPVALRRQSDLDLDLFRDGIAVLYTKDDEVAGYVATIIDQFWSPGRALTWQERAWLLITWADGRRERIEEDYPPWTLVREMQQGLLELETSPGAQLVTFMVRWLTGDEREKAWAAYGIIDEVEAYM